jgi:hypothetical protein
MLSEGDTKRLKELCSIKFFKNLVGLAACSSGIVSACEVCVGREIKSRQGLKINNK